MYLQSVYFVAKYSFILSVKIVLFIKKMIKREATCTLLSQNADEKKHTHIKKEQYKKSARHK